MNVYCTLKVPSVCSATNMLWHRMLLWWMPSVLRYHSALARYVAASTNSTCCTQNYSSSHILDTRLLVHAVSKPRLNINTHAHGHKHTTNDDASHYTTLTLLQFPKLFLPRNFLYTAFLMFTSFMSSLLWMRYVCRGPWGNISITRAGGLRHTP